MTKIDINMASKTFEKFYGVFDTKITGAKFEKKIAKTEKKSEYFNLELDVEIQKETIVQRKIFARLPYDNWDEKTIFSQLRKATELSEDQSMDTDSYLLKTFKSAIGPEKDYLGKWRTYMDKNKIERISYGIIKVLPMDASTEDIAKAEEEIEKLIVESKASLAEENRNATPEDINF